MVVAGSDLKMLNIKPIRKSYRCMRPRFIFGFKLLKKSLKITGFSLTFESQSLGCFSSLWTHHFSIMEYSVIQNQFHGLYLSLICIWYTQQKSRYVVSWVFFYGSLLQVTTYSHVHNKDDNFHIFRRHVVPWFCRHHSQGDNNHLWLEVGQNKDVIKCRPIPKHELLKTLTFLYSTHMGKTQIGKSQ